MFVSNVEYDSLMGWETHPINCINI